MRILVFGKDGQLGKAFKTFLNEESPIFYEKPSIQFVGRSECDLVNSSNLLQLLESYKPELIINASAYTAVDKAESESDLAYAINAKAPELMAQFAVSNNACLMHYSTDYVFDGEKYGFYLEDDLCNPLGVYGKSKAAGEEAIAKVFATSTQGQYAIFRTSWVYGSGANFIRTILRLAKERDQLNIITDQYGAPTCAEWLAKASLSLVLNERGEIKAFPSGIYHAVPSGETTWHGLASYVVNTALEAGVQLTVRPSEVRAISTDEYPLPAPRPMNSKMSTNKLQAAMAASDTYNEAIEFPGFIGWEQMVHEYIRKLASGGLI
ncbi:dTDP-4-dehydrorhamnose reductase [Polynucleobacter ibericus]|uniref:dTDP-4-dehydrorhamnose reductase n=1 Tax=Polynucleobacter ibericus TaxID=1819725 RepID=UPI001BFE2029|nr:dTDP-4-dehydrorhamnose reductase [Polynucleobacter ibericus]QWE08894.1 dTDP-4-dehydrorhamnose reductase [Polynucleobacter ibericus]